MAQRLARRGNESTRNRPGFQGADQKRQSARLRETLQPEDIEICKFRFIFCQTVEILYVLPHSQQETTIAQVV